AEDLGEPARRAPAAQRDLGDVVLARAVRVQLREPRRLDPSGGDAVDRDPLRAELVRKRLEVAHHAGTDGVRETEVRGWLLHGARGHRDDPAAAAALEMRQAEPG